ncbi:MAG: hypothetical protein HFG32_02585 [Eubacterium sp.]|nr:hypothetical protein [Eubacterium sp.]
MGTTTITKRIRRLKEEGIVVRAGPKKMELWIVKF